MAEIAARGTVFGGWRDASTREVKKRCKGVAAGRLNEWSVITPVLRENQ